MTAARRSESSGALAIGGKRVRTNRTTGGTTLVGVPAGSSARGLTESGSVIGWARGTYGDARARATIHGAPYGRETNMKRSAHRYRSHHQSTFILKNFLIVIFPPHDQTSDGQDIKGKWGTPVLPTGGRQTTTIHRVVEGGYWFLPGQPRAR